MQKRRVRAMLILGMLGSSAAAGEGGLAEAVAKLKLPPAWFDGVKVDFDTNRPLKDAMPVIQDLLDAGGEKAKQGVKLLYIYGEEKKQRGDGYPFFLLLGGQDVWAAKLFLDTIAKYPEGHTEMYINLASLYVKYEEPQKALELLTTALTKPPRAPWDVLHRAKMNDKLGDVYAGLANTDKAAEHYRAAIELFPKVMVPNIRPFAQRYARRTEAKLELLTRKALDISKLADGVYRGSSIGYGGPIELEVTVKSGRIADIKVQHKERIDQGASKIAPRQIIERQALNVDAISGATVTIQAIVEATYRALTEGGAK
ncbi:MAG: FMN-binding protein [Planctomycetes bacterium]|nr:FMN-binding protein [Planctomycetota bacterium]